MFPTIREQLEDLMQEIIDDVSDYDINLTLGYTDEKDYGIIAWDFCAWTEIGEIDVIMANPSYFARSNFKHIYFHEYIKDIYNFDLTGTENYHKMAIEVIVSILHELGHFVTTDKYFWETWVDEREYLLWVDDLLSEFGYNPFTVERMGVYTTLPAEYLASSWASDYYNNNKEEMDNYIKRLSDVYDKVLPRRWEENL